MYAVKNYLNSQRLKNIEGVKKFTIVLLSIEW